MAKARLIKVRRKVRIEGVLFLVFLVCLGIFTLAKTGLASYNIVLPTNSSVLLQIRRNSGMRCACCRRK